MRAGSPCCGGNVISPRSSSRGSRTIARERGDFGWRHAAFLRLVALIDLNEHVERRRRTQDAAR